MTLNNFLSIKKPAILVNLTYWQLAPPKTHCNPVVIFPLLYLINEHYFSQWTGPHSYFTSTPSRTHFTSNMGSKFSNRKIRAKLLLSKKLIHLEILTLQDTYPVLLDFKKCKALPCMNNRCTDINFPRFFLTSSAFLFFQHIQLPYPNCHFPKQSICFTYRIICSSASNQFLHPFACTECLFHAQSKGFRTKLIPTSSI